MKIKGRCRGCNSIRLINSMDLCKRCNRTSFTYMSHEEMDSRRAELEMLAQSIGSKKEKSPAKKSEEKKEGEEGEPEKEEAPKEGPGDEKKAKGRK